MFLKKLSDAKVELKNLGCDKLGYEILKNKEEIHSFYIYDLKAPAANILKQEALASGADFALPKDAILYQKEKYDGILMLSIAQSKALIKKLSMQPFGLKELAQELKKHLQTPKNKIRFMGIINATPDSFYASSRKSENEACKKIEELIEQGADIIDIGGASSRPGSAWVDKNEELKRIKPLADFIKLHSLYKRVDFSIDTYEPKVAQICLESGFKIVNDITGFTKPKMLEAIRGYECECVVMHMQGEPRSMQENPNYVNLFLEIENFFKRQIEALQNNGNSQIILDVGIGFGKTLEHNCELIKHLGHFLHLGYPLLVGASRKSMIDAIYPSCAEERLAGTLAIHLEAIRKGASIIRVHDLKEHIQAYRVWEALQ
ncbi:dihydropteroate synthase [Helicobacter burdigaliensis]|uniref:dihydropteroate synthase n=1 Tax=Helicobacter burdigaliensis TaxID=2315334 RepID=UPI000EF6F0D5|nr:dihydropteroate synthase [Helicobacter burdigaliensis]